MLDQRRAVAAWRGRRAMPATRRRRWHRLALRPQLGDERRPARAAAGRARRRARRGSERRAAARPDRRVWCAGTWRDGRGTDVWTPMRDSARASWTRSERAELAGDAGPQSEGCATGSSPRRASGSRSCSAWSRSSRSAAVRAIVVPVGAAADVRARARRAPLRRALAGVGAAGDHRAGAGVQRHRGQPRRGRGGTAAARRAAPGRARRGVSRSAARAGVRRSRAAVPARERGLAPMQPPDRGRAPRQARCGNDEARGALAEVLEVRRGDARPRDHDRTGESTSPATSRSTTSSARR